MEVQAVMWYFGFSKEEAISYVKLLTANNETWKLKQVVDAFLGQAKMSYYTD